MSTAQNEHPNLPNEFRADFARQGINGRWKLFYSKDRDMNILRMQPGIWTELSPRATTRHIKAEAKIQGVTDLTGPSFDDVLLCVMMTKGKRIMP